MVAQKINRFSLEDLKKITIRCKNCGATLTVSAQAEKYNIYSCPECMQRFGEMANDVVGAISSIFSKANKVKDIFSVEFDVEEGGN